MNLNNILKSICTAFVKGNKIMCGNYIDGRVGITTDGFHAYFIKKEEFPFDVGKFIQCDWKAMVPKNSTDATLTNELLIKDKNTLQMLTDGKIQVWINTVFLKNFEKSATFKLSGEKSPVLVFEDDTMVGLILPVRTAKN